MKFSPNDLFVKLEFDKIKELILKECLGQPAVDLAAGIEPIDEVKKIDLLLSETIEFKHTFIENHPFPISPYQSIQEELRYLEIQDYVLPVEDVLNIYRLLLITSAIFTFFTAERIQLFPLLYSKINGITFDKQLLKEIERVIDEEGNVRPEASPELLKLRKSKNAKLRELDKKFNLLLIEFRNKGYLTDSAETFRNGRRVLSVPVEHKRKIKGIIHDESTTGKTAFIEPEGVISINNDIFDIEIEERKEIFRILKVLSGRLRPYIPFMRNYEFIVVQMDFLRAKARLALITDAKRPKLTNKPQIDILNGFHPLLRIKNNALGKETVPFDLFLKENNRILVLSGPNAGGKSITMKSIGLMQLMVQSGIPVPVDENSEFGVFNEIFADIGDQQSIEDDLSTYSSRLRNMKHFLDHSSAKSLVLIDEFGSGTDPKIGGAIAEAILHQFNQLNVFGIITTHYSNLKMYAFKNQGLVNGAMSFNKENLSPSFRLKVGKPGSSYAFEIAHKSGLGLNVIDYARKKTGDEVKAVDDLLMDLEADQKLLREKLEDIHEKEKNLINLIKNYEQLHKDLDLRRKKFKIDSKAQELLNLDQKNKDLDRLVRKIKEEKNIELAKLESEKVRETKKQVSEEIKVLQEEIYQSDAHVDNGFQKGSTVKLRFSEAIGIIETINKDKAVIQMGDLRFTAEIRDLVHAGQPLEINRKRSIATDIYRPMNDVEFKLDIRGMRLEEAVQLVEAFLDKALLAGNEMVQIIHGKGTGVLRNAVKKKLREYPNDMTISYASPEQGGDGVTNVVFN
jgi:DNA mismatch repair protein MutS2